MRENAECVCEMTVYIKRILSWITEHGHSDADAYEALAYTLGVTREQTASPSKSYLKLPE